MGEKRNYAALDWVIGEIGDALNEARQALEAYAEDSRDITRIRFCLTHIHQVLGSLKMVEFHGAALFAEEMEDLTEAIINKSVVNENEAQEVLMRALLQLPIYLEHVKRIQDDHPGIVLPLLNDLRAARKEPYLSETNLFTPELASLEKITGQRHPLLKSEQKLKEVLKKLFEMYQYAAASVLRGIKIEENLVYVSKVFTRLENTSGGTVQGNLWLLAGTLVDSLIEDEIELSVAVKGILRRLAKEIKNLYDNAPQAFDAPIDQALARNILYYVARSGDVTERIRKVKDLYGLDNALFEGAVEGRDFHKNMISAPEPDTIRSVVAALRDEMNTVKQILNHVVIDGGATSDLEAALPIVKRVADTLAVLGVAELRHATNAQHDRLAQACASADMNVDELTDVANELVVIEHRLDAIAKGANKANLNDLNERDVEIDEAKIVVLQESRVGLERLKEAIVEFYSSQWDKSALNSAEGLIRDVRGGLSMIPLTRAANIVDICGQYIQQQFIADDAKPTADALTALANAIEGVDYYLDRLIGDFTDDVESFLELSEDALRELGCNVSTVTEGELDDESADSQTAQFDDAEVEPLLTEVESTQGDNGAVSAEQDHTEAAESDEAAAPQDDSEIAVDEATSDALPEVPTLAQAAEVPFELDPDVDEDIAEIFVEEAREVLETLAEALPQWQGENVTGDAVATARRSFHTLKGSGRMVKASDISELAWSVENLLNRIMDGSIPLAAIHRDFIGRVYDLLPALISAFEQRVISSQQALAKTYQQWGHQLSQGETPADFADANVGDSLDTDTPQAGASDQASASEQAITEGDDSDASYDAAEEKILWELFASEAQTHIAAIEEFIAEMDEAAPLFTAPTDGLQRALHTLKGSAHMAGVSQIAQLATPLELFMKEMRSYQVKIDADILQLIKDAVDYTREGLTFIERDEQAQIPKLEQFTARVAELKDVHLGHLLHASEGKGTEVAHPVDPRMLAIFMAEEISLLLDADEVLDRWQTDLGHTNELPAMMAELKTLETGAEQANFPPMAKLSGELHDLYAAALDRLAPDNALFDTFRAAHNTLLDMVDAVAAAQTLPLPSEHLQQALDDYLSVCAELPEVSADFEDELLELDDVQPDEEPVDSDPEAPALTGEQIDATAFDDIDADDVVIEPTSGYSEDDDALDLSFVGDDESLVTSSLSDASREASSDSTDIDGDSDDLAIEMDASDLFDSDSLDAFADAADQAPEPSDIGGDVAAPQETLADFNDLAGDITAESSTQQDFSESAGALDATTDDGESSDSIFVGGDPSLINADDFDEEIIEIFVEEADELVEELEEAIHAWESDWSSTEAPDEMKRALHTLKGGARLSGLTVLGELTHEYETYLINKVSPDRTANFFEAVHQYQDLVLKGVRGVKARLAGEPVEAPQAVEPPSSTSDDRPTSSGAVTGHEARPTPPETSLDLAPAVVEKPDEPKPEFAMPPSPALQEAKNVAAAAKKSGSQEVVKISSELLEELVNLAGETSISRGRLEQQVSDFGSAIGEIDITLRRLQEQLRRLDMETEAQIVFRQEQLADNEEFDPLEMDRYSQLQQLSRSLTESASDLVDLKRTLSDKVKDTEAILLQQQRINSSLQEGLMRARMVPFSRMVPRLRRIVRQVASELNKQVSFELDNVEGEMDRSVLEHMVAPLEHMLRNAVDHGIESPAERLAAGKPENGRILLSFAREGGDILLRLADDGQGIALEKVRQKAIERGLMAPEAELSEHDIMQFILQAGFSTADNVTQISGRGVGMDVVAAEIKQLGGSMTIESKPGVGTQFTVRLPFTVSVNRALMVNLGKESYAIPLNTIEGIVRVSPFELEHYYSQEDARFEYAGESYEVRYLGGMLYEEMQPRLEGQVMPLPVILVRSAQHTMALQVDGLMGSREIVVKSLGAQFSAVQGLSGATVMGDGSVVVILDPHALVRRAVATIGLAAPTTTGALEATERMTKTVMVVDDSVTVRKVTTRFLEREGFNVITAKDGVDALQVLQTRTPDIMLLDIEMPRMDGFEVAKNMRTSEEWAHIPIVMITSRTGDKHREHALSIGVNHYLGKPYQEELLLESINELLEA
ncbi:MAG TPA: Hpt domain-containing protein [Marinagarivorans sp.]